MRKDMPPQTPPSAKAATAERIAALNNHKKTAKRHAARKTRASALALSVLTTGSLAGYLARNDQQLDSPLGEIAATIEEPESQPAQLAGSRNQSDVPASTETTVASTNDAYADGVYIGSSVGTEWGPVQVSVSLASDQIVAVDVLAIPDSDRKSRRINSTAGPALVSDSLIAQTADVDIVSGATYTSRAYQESLQSALDDSAVALSQEQAQ